MILKVYPDQWDATTITNSSPYTDEVLNSLGIVGGEDVGPELKGRFVSTIQTPVVRSSTEGIRFSEGTHYVDEVIFRREFPSATEFMNPIR